MQGQRGTIGSLPETLDFDHGTTSNNAAIDQQICWNNLRNPAENRMPDYILSPNDMNIALVNSVSRERQNLSRWCLGEPSSSNTQNEVSLDERKTELGWSSSISPCAVSGPRSEERRYEAPSNLSLDNNVNHVFTQSSSSDSIPQNLNLNASFVGPSGDNSQVMECPNTYKCGGSGNEQIRPANGSDPFLLPSGGAGFLVGGNEDGPGCSLEGRRVSCKRKAIEGNVGQSSVSGSCSYFQQAESSTRPGAPTHYSAGSSLSIPASSEQGTARLGLGGREVTSDSLPDSSGPGSSESSRRNFRVRINPSNQQNSISPPVFSTGRTARHSSGLSSQLSPSLLPGDHSLDLRQAPAVGNMNPQSQPAAVHVPTLPQNMQPLRWSGGSSSRTGSSSSSMVQGNRDAPVREELSSRGLARNMSDHPIFVPAAELRNLVRHPAGRNAAGGNINIPGNGPPTSRHGSSSSVHPPSVPAWAPHHSPPPQYSRRLSEYVRRSLFSSAGPESGGQSSNYLPLRSGQPASSQEMLLSSGAGNQGYHQAHPRSASWMERQNDGGLGIHYSLRNLAAASEGSNRLVSEVCSRTFLFGYEFFFENCMWII